MSPEKLIEAFARGLMAAAIGYQEDVPPKPRGGVRGKYARRNRQFKGSDPLPTQPEPDDSALRLFEKATVPPTVPPDLVERVERGDVSEAELEAIDKILTGQIKVPPGFYEPDEVGDRQPWKSS